MINMSGFFESVKSKLKKTIYFSIIISVLFNGCSNTKYVPVITSYEIKISKAIKGDRSTLFMDGSSKISVTQNKIRFRDKKFRLNRKLKALQLNYFFRSGCVEFGSLGFNQIVDFPVRIPFGKDTIEIISADCKQISYKKLSETNLNHLFIKDSISSNSSFRFDTLYPTKFNKNADTTIILTECRSKIVFKNILDLETYKLSETCPF
jgi:hypothetical protein